MCGIVPGPGWFGLSREKEAAGAARRMPLPMGFECRSFGDGSGKTGLAEGANALSAFAAFAANWIGLPKWKRTPKKGMTLGYRHTGGATLPKRRGASHKCFDAMSCQDDRPGRFGSGEVGLR